jgi:hypothetical protein
MIEIKNVYEILVRKVEGKRPHGIAGHKLEDNIKMNLEKIVCVIGDWNNLA